jgi:DNA-binding NtrC family response regulator
MRNNVNILVVDTDKKTCQSLTDLLLDEGYSIINVHSGEEAMQQLSERIFDLAIVELKLPKMDGLEVLRRIRVQNGSTQVIILTGHGTIKTSVEAMKEGAFDYLTKPCNKDEVKIVIKNALQQKFLIEENRELREKLEIVEGIEFVVGKSEKMRKVCNYIETAANTDLTVLIEGDSGTGKELIASAIHHKSSRSNKPLIKTNCAALQNGLFESEFFGHAKGAFTDAIKEKQGLFEAANEGTLFLDEISALSSHAQAKLLRVIEQKEFMRLGNTHPIKVDVRLIAATNKDLRECVKEREFREDLYHRLNVFPIYVPPLRERKEDIPMLVDYFLQKYNKLLDRAFKGISRGTLELLSAYHWPGNVRELENLVARILAVQRGSTIVPAHLPEYIQNQATSATILNFQEAKRNFEREYLTELLKRNRGNITRSAQQASMDRKNFREKLKKYHISRQLFL